MRIVTDFIYPPIPDRSCDWCAYDGDTYDGEGCPMGLGAAEAEAVADLKTQIAERENA